ncbi:hypothetical protein [Fodinicurvata halophila]|uniref:hypothetical protein n=1 Tax=Fodinicurvata halophila TaxID=1419723 RepID=UPI003644F85C
MQAQVIQGVVQGADARQKAAALFVAADIAQFAQGVNDALGGGTVYLGRVRKF